MELIRKCLFAVAIAAAILICNSQSQWAPSMQKPWASPSQLSKNPVPSTTTPPPFDKCRVEEGAKIQCGTTDVTPEQCQSIACCYDGRQCYYGRAVTVQCTKDGQFVVVVAQDSTLPHIDVDSITLLETNHESCSPAGFTAAFTIFQFAVTLCGTKTREEDGFVVYENHMSSSYEVGIGPKGSITRDSHFELLFQCRYSGTAVEALVIEVNDVPSPLPVAAAGPLRVELRLGNGQCHTKGCVEEVAAYSSYYSATDYPITKSLREPVYVEVHILDRSDPNVVLTLEHCWATSAPEPASLPQWDLLLNGCPYSEDHYLTTSVLVDASSGLPYPTHYKRFIMRMLAFVDQNTYVPQHGMVFIHCSTSVCYPSRTDSCEPQCHRQRKRATNVSSNQRALVSSGKVILTNDLTFPPSHRENDSTRASELKE